jgi:hypothetical protein
VLTKRAWSCRLARLGPAAFIRRLVLVRRKAAGLRAIAQQFIDSIIAQVPANAERYAISQIPE